MKLKSKSIIVLIILISTSLILNYFLQKVPPKLISSSPINTTKNILVTQEITLIFDKPVNLTDISLVSSPEEKWILNSKNDSTIVAKSDRILQSDTNYTLTLSYKNTELANLNFTTIGGQADPRFNQQIQDELVSNFPLMGITPYITNNYSVEYTAPLSLQITLKNNILSQDEILSQTKDWVRSQGVDPSTHKYTVVTPSPAP